MTDTAHISVASDFSVLPAGITRKDGPYSAEAFLHDVLVPCLLSRDCVVLNLDDTQGYASSFLQKVFGDLVAKHDFREKSLRKWLVIESKDFSLVLEAWSYIVKAELALKAFFEKTSP